MTIRLGFDHFSIRDLGWKAPALVDYARDLGVQVLLLSDLDVHESLEDGALRELRSRADHAGIALHVGTGSICPSSVMFDPRRGTAREQLETTIRVARALGSPVARCFLGRGEDRATPGGIGVHIRHTIATCRVVRSVAIDSGVKIALENHAGDLTARELVGLIQEAGPEYVGATMDSGNATWTQEDPLESLELLGPHALTTGIRDSRVWETPEGTAVQWVAMGDGAVDWPVYLNRFGVLCPGAPFVLEIIPGAPRIFPRPKDPGNSWLRFSAMARRGTPPAGPPPRSDDPGVQKGALERSLRYVRELLAGRITSAGRDAPRRA